VSRNIVNDHARHLLESYGIPSSLSSFFFFLNYPINGNFNYFICKNVKNRSLGFLIGVFVLKRNGIRPPTPLVQVSAQLDKFC
jgi:hypothetical protein